MLVVDDTPLNRVVLGGMVRRAGLDVVEAANGAEALEKVRRPPPSRPPATAFFCRKRFRERSLTLALLRTCRCAPSRRGTSSAS